MGNIPITLDWFKYAISYHKSATILFSQFKDGENGSIFTEHGEIKLDSVKDLIYPILFAYRHSVELYLKIFAKMKAVFNGSDAVGIAQITGHKLEDLLSDAKDFIELLAKNGVEEERIRKIKDNISGFMSKEDEMSFTFRYPTRKVRAGNPPMPSTQIPVFNLRNYVDQTESLLEELQALWTMATSGRFLVWTLDQKNELQKDYIIF